MEKSGDWTSETRREDEERWEGRSQERLKRVLKIVCGKEKRDSARAAAIVNGTLRT